MVVVIMVMMVVSIFCFFIYGTDIINNEREGEQEFIY